MSISPQGEKNRLWRLTKRALQLIFWAFVLTSVFALVQGWPAFGKHATGARLLRMQHSSRYRDGHFVNPQPLYNDLGGMLSGMWHGRGHVNPDAPVHVATLSKQAFDAPPASGLRVTWFGHSSMLIEIEIVSTNAE